jgi:hypothetical protein
MVDDWDSFIVKDQPKVDEWSLYELKPMSKEVDSKVNSLLGATTAVGSVALAGLGLAKTGIPQKIVKGVDTVGRGIANLPKVTNMKKGADFAQSIRASFVQAHSDKVATFGNQIEQLSGKYPNNPVSLQNTVETINNNWSELTPEVKSVLKKTPYLKNMVGLKPKTLVTDLSLSKSQEIINYMNTKVPKNIRYNNLEVVDTLNGIRGAQLEGVPEMADVRADYKKFIEPYNQVKSKFKFNSLLDSIKNKFGGAEGQTAVEKVLPKDVVKKIGGYRTAAKIAELPQDVPLVGRTLKTIGGMFSYTPMAIHAFRIWQMENDPEGQYNLMIGNELPPKGSMEREIQQGRIL